MEWYHQKLMLTMPTRIVDRVRADRPSISHNASGWPKAGLGTHADVDSQSVPLMGLAWA